MNILFACLFVGIASAQLKNWSWDEVSPLDAYVRKHDSSYSWEQISQFDIDNIDNRRVATAYVLNMTSQTWKDASVSSRPVWWHHLTVIVPTRPDAEIRDTAFLFIGGGSNNDGPPTVDDIFVEILGDWADSVGAVAGYLKQVPNQPVTLPQSTEPTQSRSEDAIIGWTWRHFIENENADPEILLRMPMTKAVVRAFDTITNFTSTLDVTPRYNIQKFVPAGASKRGWTTWTVACVDRRVVAMGPMVLSALKLVETISYHYRAYGGWSFAFGDYYRENVTKHLLHPRTQALADIVDPYSYRQRLTMPKIVIQATGDEFFRPEEPNHWFNDLPNPKHLWLVENTHHGLTFAYTDIAENLAAFFLSVVRNEPVPELTWTMTKGNSSATITATISRGARVTAVNLWLGDSVVDETDSEDNGRTRRDFRWFTAAPDAPGEVDLNAVVWNEQNGAITVGRSPTGQQQWTGTQSVNPAGGWRGFFLEFVVETPRGNSLTFTTGLNVIPDYYPFPFCTNEVECRGTIV